MEGKNTNTDNSEAKQIIEMVGAGFDAINKNLEVYANMLEEEVGKVVKGEKENE